MISEKRVEARAKLDCSWERQDVHTPFIWILQKCSIVIAKPDWQTDFKANLEWNFLS